jgi:TRAP-type mannitol/chloroaromatic compound transport system permease small subunit
LSSSSDLALCLSLAFDRLLSFFLFVSFLFLFSCVTSCEDVVNALIKGEIEDHVWFDDRWMVASLGDE